MLIGPHGQAMTFMMFTRPFSVLFELLPYGFGSFDYRNMAMFGGKSYFYWLNTDIKDDVAFCLDDGNNTEPRFLGRSPHTLLSPRALETVMHLFMVSLSSLRAAHYDFPCYDTIFLSDDTLHNASFDCSYLHNRDSGLVFDTESRQMVKPNLTYRIRSCF